MLSILLWIMAGMVVLSMAAVVSQVGKPKVPTTPGVAVVSVLVSLFYLVVLVTAAITLAGV